MGSLLLQPDSDISGLVQSGSSSPGWSITPGNTGNTGWSVLSDDNDSTFIVQGLPYAVVQLQSPIFLDSTSVIGAVALIRAATASSKHTGGITVQVYKADGATALTAPASTGAITTSLVDYSLTLTLTGSELTTDWTGAQLWISSTNNQAMVYKANVTISYPSVVPDAPDGLYLKNDVAFPVSRLDLYFDTSPVDNEGVTLYIIQRADSLGGTFADYDTATGSPYIDTGLGSGLTPATEYAYQVAAVNSIGTGAYSEPVAGATRSDTPAIVTATAVSSSQINVQWTIPTIGNNCQLGSVGIGFLVYMELPYLSGNWLLVDDALPGDSSYNITGLDPDTQIDVAVYAKISPSNGDSWSMEEGPLLGPVGLFDSQGSLVYSLSATSTPATTFLERNYTPAGGIRLSGVAPLTSSRNYVPTGGISFAGTDPSRLGRGQNYVSSGGLRFGGEANWLPQRPGPLQSNLIRIRSPKVPGLQTILTGVVMRAMLVMGARIINERPELHLGACQCFGMAVSAQNQKSVCAAIPDETNLDMTDSSLSDSLSESSGDFSSGPACYRRQSVDHVITLLGADGALLVEAALVGLDADSVTLDWTTVDPDHSWEFCTEFLGGSAITSSDLIEFETTLAAEAQIFPGAGPGVVAVFMSANFTFNTSATAADSATLAYGYAVSPTQRGAIAFNSLTSTTHVCYRQSRIDRCLSIPQNTFPVTLWSADLAAFLPNGIELNFIDIDPANTYFGWALVLGGFFQANTYSGTTPTSLEVDQVNTGNALTFAMLFCDGAVLGTDPFVAPDISHCVGMATGADNQQAALFVDKNDVMLQETKRRWVNGKFLEAYQP